MTMPSTHNYPVAMTTDSVARHPISHSARTTKPIRAGRELQRPSASRKAIRWVSSRDWRQRIYYLRGCLVSQMRGLSMEERRHLARLIFVPELNLARPKRQACIHHDDLLRGSQLHPKPAKQHCRYQKCGVPECIGQNPDAASGC